MPHTSILAATKAVNAHRARPTHIRSFATTSDGLVVALPPRSVNPATARSIVAATARAERTVTH
jgi:hypothetical protein